MKLLILFAIIFVITSSGCSDVAHPTDRVESSDPEASQPPSTPVDEEKDPDHQPADASQQSTDNSARDQVKNPTPAPSHEATNAAGADRSEKPGIHDEPQRHGANTDPAGQMPDAAPANAPGNNASTHAADPSTTSSGTKDPPIQTPDPQQTDHNGTTPLPPTSTPTTPATTKDNGTQPGTPAPTPTTPPKNPGETHPAPSNSNPADDKSHIHDSAAEKPARKHPLYDDKRNAGIDGQSQDKSGLTDTLYENPSAHPAARDRQSEKQPPASTDTKSKSAINDSSLDKFAPPPPRALTAPTINRRLNTVQQKDVLPDTAYEKKARSRSFVKERPH